MSASPTHPVHSRFTANFTATLSSRNAAFWWQTATVLLGVLLAVVQTSRFVEISASLWGAQTMFWICLVIFGSFVMCAIGLVALFRWGEIEFGTGMIMVISWFVSIALFAFLYNEIAHSQRSWVGMFQYGRMNEIAKATHAVKKDSASQSLPQVLIDVSSKTDGAYIQKAYVFTADNWWGENYRRAMLSARLLGFEKTPEFQQALGQGWLSMKQSDTWAKQLRNQPPEILKASPLHQAAYLRMIGEVSFDRKFNIEGEKK